MKAKTCRHWLGSWRPREGAAQRGRSLPGCVGTAAPHQGADGRANEVNAEWLNYSDRSARSLFFKLESKNEMKKALGETQTLHAGCSIRRSQKHFTPPQTPFPGVHDGQNLISWRWSLPAPTDIVWWRSMHAISSYRGNRHRPPARPLQTPVTDRTDNNTLRR